MPVTIAWSEPDGGQGSELPPSGDPAPTRSGSSRLGFEATRPDPGTRRLLPTVKGQRGDLWSLEAALAVTVALLLPVGLFMAGLGALNRTAFPALSLALAVVLYTRRSPWLLGLLIWLFCTTPLIRRLTDFQSGFDPANPLQVAPYLAAAVAGLSFLPYLLRPVPRFGTPFLWILLAIAWGLLLALIDGRVTSGVIDALKWSAGPLVAVHLLHHAEQTQAFNRVTITSLLLAAPAMAAYGIAQFIDPAAFDKLWMINVQSLGLDSIGAPAPFEVRVFATMNSPGSLAIMLMVGIVVLLTRPLLAMLPPLLVTGLGLALTQYRSVWLATLVATLTMLAAAPLAGRLRILLGALAIIAASGGLALVPEIDRVLSDRFDTLGRLESDKSGEERLHEYQRFFSRSDGLILGQGIAATGATRQLDGRAVTVIDAGLLEPLIAFGVFGGAAFFGALVVLVWPIVGVANSEVASIHLCRGVIAGSLAVLPFGRALVGETGFGLWLFIGLGLASILVEQRRARLRADLHALAN